MKSSIRPDRADKIRKMFSARKSIPIVPSPKKNSRQEILKIINRRPDAIVQRQHEAQESLSPDQLSYTDIAH